MRRLRALLVGVAEYEDGNIPPLPCVPGDLHGLRAALESHGYSVETPYTDGRVGRTRMLGAVSKFLESGRPEDTLLVYLSGHGVHLQGEDYLVPHDADFRYLELRDVSVPLTSWNAAIDRSAGGGVVFLVDACREGIDEAMGLYTRTAWSPDKRRQAERRRVAWIYPCAVGQTSRYVRADGTKVPQPFSLFARSVVNVLQAPGPPVTLKEFESALQEAMNLLTEEHGKQKQDIHLITNGRSDADQFELFPPEMRRRVDWEHAAASHPAWDRAGSPPRDADLRPGVLALVRDLANHRHAANAACKSDPWTEVGRFALRMTQQMIFILNQLPRDLTLTQAEAALLITMPFLLDAHEAVRVGNAVSQAMPEDDDEWWETHSLMAREPDPLAEENLSVLLAAVPPGTPGGEVLTPVRIRALLRAARAENSAFAPNGELGLASRITITDERSGTHELRERLVGILMTVAYRLTIDALALPSLVPGDHGLFGPIRPADLHATLAKATWQPYGRGRTLTASCGHPAVEWALRKHIARLDELFAHLDARSADPDLKELRYLPVRAVAFHVGPVMRHGRPAYNMDDYIAAEASSRGRLRFPGDYLLATGSEPISLAPASDTATISPVSNPIPPPDPAPSPVDTDGIVRRLLEISEAAETDGSVQDLEAFGTALADPVNAGQLVDQLADGWENAGYEKRVLDGFLRLLGSMRGNAPLPALRSALSRRGYLAERLAAQYHDDINFQVDSLRIIVRTAWNGEDFGRAAVDDTLRRVWTPALIKAVLSLTGPVDSELREYINQRYVHLHIIRSRPAR